MNTPTIYITEPDREKLKDLIRKAYYTEYRGSDYLKSLAGEIDKAKVVDPHKIPPDVITLNSTAQLIDLETNDEMTYTLVFPDDADVAQGKISILAPIGTAMLGYRVGDIFEWETPGGIRKIKVLKILFQPEASGNFE